MESYSRILVGTDGSPDATAAVRLGALIARNLKAPLSIMVAFDGDDGHDEGWAAGVLADAETAAKATGASVVTTETIAGDGADILVDVGIENPSALVVVGSTGLSSAARRIGGSTSNTLSHHSHADVLFAREPLPKIWHFAALATDGTPTSLQAVRRGIVLATALGATPRLVTAARSTEAGEKTLADTLAALASDGIDSGIEAEVIVNSDPSQAIVTKAWKWEVLVIGNKSMSGVGRLLGSVANKITHGAEINLLLVNTTRS